MLLRTTSLPVGSRAVLLLLLALTALAGAPAHGAVIADRTQRLSVTPAGLQTAGTSSDPAVAVDGRTVAFTTTGADLVDGDANGAVADVVAVDLVTGSRRLVSDAPGGANGPSTAPALSGDGNVVVFGSDAANLVPGDLNGQPDVFARTARGPVVRVSVGADGSPANGASWAPDVSADGRRVTFVSTATNLVREPDRNGQPDIFVRDLARGVTTLVSATGDGAPGNGRSGSPAISGDGQHVAFESDATDLGEDPDRNGVADVFVRDLEDVSTVVASVSSTERPQDRAVAMPFRMQPDISRDGRLVVWESDARNLVAGDTNQRTDIFLRDLRRGQTRLVSASTTSVQGDNDSFGPRLSSGGRFLAFQSFAANLVPGEDGPREDVFVRDLERGTTTVVNVTGSGAPRLGEIASQVLQRPALSNDATRVAFTSTVPNLVAGDTNGAPDVFLRRMDPPQTQITEAPTARRRRVRFAADDPQATSFICRLDDATPFRCGSAVDVSDLVGKRLGVQAAGPGLLPDPMIRVARLWRDERRPAARLRAAPRGRTLRVVRGSAGDRGPSGVAHVDVAVTQFTGGRGGRSCRKLDGRRVVRGSCSSAIFTRATGREAWSVRIPGGMRGFVAIRVRATDRAGNVSRTATGGGFYG